MHLAAPAQRHPATTKSFNPKQASSSHREFSNHPWQSIAAAWNKNELRWQKTEDIKGLA